MLDENDDDDENNVIYHLQNYLCLRLKLSCRFYSNHFHSISH